MTGRTRRTRRTRPTRRTRRTRRTVAAALAALGAALGTVTACSSGPSAPTPEPTPVRRVVWRDAFDGAAGAAPSAANWTNEVGGDGWGNQELEYYTPGAQNARLDGSGHLLITADKAPANQRLTCWYGPCTHVSARLSSERKVTLHSGRLEARIKMPRGQGLWPAFWLLGANRPSVGYPGCGEIDVAEVIGSEPGVTWASLHGPGYVRAGLTRGFTLPDQGSFSDDFHTFAVDWTDDGLAFAIDGAEYYRVRRGDIGENKEWVFDKPFFVIVNLAVGGEWPGSPSADTAFPATMVVDEVTVFE